MDNHNSLDSAANGLPNPIIVSLFTLIHSIQKRHSIQKSPVNSTAKLDYEAMYYNLAKACDELHADVEELLADAGVPEFSDLAFMSTSYRILLLKKKLESNKDSSRIKERDDIIAMLRTNVDQLHAEISCLYRELHARCSDADSSDLTTIHGCYYDLLNRLGVLGHAGAVAEIAALRKRCGLD